MSICLHSPSALLVRCFIQIIPGFKDELKQDMRQSSLIRSSDHLDNIEQAIDYVFSDKRSGATHLLIGAFDRIVRAFAGSGHCELAALLKHPAVQAVAGLSEFASSLCLVKDGGLGVIPRISHGLHNGHEGAADWGLNLLVLLCVFIRERGRAQLLPPLSWLERHVEEGCKVQTRSLVGKSLQALLKARRQHLAPLAVVRGSSFRVDS